MLGINNATNELLLILFDKWSLECNRRQKFVCIQIYFVDEL